MESSKLLSDDKKLNDQAARIEEKIKENQSSQEELRQLSREGQGFLQETLGFLRGSSDSHIFQGLYDEQVLLDKRVRLDFEREQDELQRDYRFVTAQAEEIASKRQKLEKEEKYGS